MTIMTTRCLSRLPQRPWRAAAAASLCLAALAAAGPAQAQQDGQLLAGVRRTIRDPHIAELVDLRSGARRALPMSNSSLARRLDVDTWSASRTSAHTLLRTDDTGQADLFDSVSLRPLSSFSLKSIPGTHEPRFLGIPRLSPDGRYVLTYWIRNANNYAPELAVFDGQGHVVRQVAAASERNRALTQAIAWTPKKGRYVYLDEDGINVCQLDTPRCLAAPLRLPPDMGMGNVQVDVSPDGQHLALVLGRQWPDSNGQRVAHSALFAANLDGTGLRQLTAPSRALQQSGTDYAPLNPQWSPDGRWIAYTPRGTNPIGAVGFHNACAETRVVSAQAGVQELGAAAPPQALLKAGGAPVSICSFMQWID